MNVIVKISVAEWLRQGAELFGEDFMKWRFVCPACKNIATVEDFKAFKDKGATPNSATQNCIGRYSGGNWGKGTKPCDYAAYGLFHLSPVIVVQENGNEIQAFAFDGWPIE